MSRDFLGNSDPFTSRVTKINSDDYKNKYGLLAKRVLPAGQLVELYRANKLSVAVYVTVNITNANTNQSKTRLWVTDKVQPVMEDLYESGIFLESDAVYNRTFILLSSNEAIFALCDIGDNVVRLDGVDDRPVV